MTRLLIPCVYVIVLYGVAQRDIYLYEWACYSAVSILQIGCNCQQQPTLKMHTIQYSLLSTKALQFSPNPCDKLSHDSQRAMGSSWHRFQSSPTKLAILLNFYRVSGSIHSIRESGYLGVLRTFCIKCNRNMAFLNP